MRFAGARLVAVFRPVARPLGAAFAALVLSLTGVLAALALDACFEATLRATGLRPAFFRASEVRGVRAELEAVEVLRPERVATATSR